MRRVSATRLVSRCLLGLSLGVLITSQAQAFEAFDGRLQAHGFYEMQLRAINADYSEDWNVTQWYNVFNLELELDLGYRELDYQGTTDPDLVDEQRLSADALAQFQIN